VSQVFSIIISFIELSSAVITEILDIDHHLKLKNPLFWGRDAPFSSGRMGEGEYI
jgi:hypothetical protein